MHQTDQANTDPRRRIAGFFDAINYDDGTVAVAGYLAYMLKDDPEWKLVNRRVHGGRVNVSMSEVRLMLERMQEPPRPHKAHSSACMGVPPCMRELMERLRGGIHVPYVGRLALASWAGKAEMAEDDIVELFEGSPDFSERITRDQVRGILQKGLMPANCGRIRAESDGVCRPDAGCRRIKNPIRYRPTAG